MFTLRSHVVEIRRAMAGIGGRAALLDDLRAQVARIERRPVPSGRAVAATAVPFGVAEIDRVLPGGGIARGALHEAAGSSVDDAEHGAAAALLAAGVLARAGGGPVLWV